MPTVNLSKADIMRLRQWAREGWLMYVWEDCSYTHAGRTEVARRNYARIDAVLKAALKGVPDAG